MCRITNIHDHATHYVDFNTCILCHIIHARILKQSRSDNYYSYLYKYDAVQLWTSQIPRSVPCLLQYIWKAKIGNEDWTTNSQVNKKKQTSLLTCWRSFDMLLAGRDVLSLLCNLLPVAPLIEAAGGREAILPRPRFGGMGGGVGAERPLSSQLSSSLSPVLVET